MLLRSKNRRAFDPMVQMQSEKKSRVPDHPSPLIVATWSFSARGCRKTLPDLLSRSSALEAVCGVAREAEADPSVDSVGFGGLPDATGKVTLDASVMVAPERCGSVCAVGRHLFVTDLARKVMERTSHVMLAGEGADAFADAMDMPSTDLLSPAAAQAWQRWRVGEPIGRPIDAGPSTGQLFTTRSTAAHAPVPERHPKERETPHDTIGVLAIDRAGALAGACSTSGLPFKLAGRVGDSPIIGHGLYVDPEAGGAVATGTGEMVMGVNGTFLAVECMRRGATPSEAVHEVLTRIERRFRPKTHQQVALIALSRTGEWSAGALRSGFIVSCAQASGTEMLQPQFVMHPEDVVDGPHPADAGGGL
jgi:isoaspartyl peptidase/L-asparaginase-like protein (Ntn-hydrolase superfamily)